MEDVCGDVFNVSLMLIMSVGIVFLGPWGDEMAEEYSDLAHRIAAAPGLIWKV